jgi:hypothetical protein
MTTIRTVRIGWVVTAAVVASGCGSGGKSPGSVAGTVTYNGVSLTAGSLNLISKAGTAALAKIDASGAFKVDSRLEPGDYAAYVTPPEPEPPVPGAKAPAPKKFDVPTKFQSPNTSGVTVTVKAGANDLRVDFK